MEYTLSEESLLQLKPDKDCLPIRYPVINISTTDSYQENEEVMRFIFSISSVSPNPVVPISDAAKPFLSTVYDMYTCSGELKEKTTVVMLKVREIHEDVLSLNSELQKALLGLPWTSKIFSRCPTFLRKLFYRRAMLPTMSKLEPLISKIFSKSQSLIKNVAAQGLHKSFKVLNNRLSHQFLHHTSLQQNNFVQQELEYLKVGSAITVLLISVLKDVKELEVTQEEFSEAVKNLIKMSKDIGHYNFVEKLGL